jgi:hypothetical protein
VVDVIVRILLGIRLRRAHIAVEERKLCVHLGVFVLPWGSDAPISWLLLLQELGAVEGFSLDDLGLVGYTFEAVLANSQADCAQALAPAAFRFAPG